MQTLKLIPKVLEDIEDVHRTSDSHQMLVQYKKNMKAFIEKVTAEVSSMMERYEKAIKQLKLQNQMLQKGNKPQNIGFLPLESPIKNKKTSNQFVKSNHLRSTNLDMMQTAKSNIFTPFVSTYEQPRFAQSLGKYRKSYEDDGNFPMELINPEPSEELMSGGKSRFEAKSNIKKQREQQLVHYLQTGRKNLYSTTEQFMSSIGRAKRYESEDNKHEKEVNNHSQESASKNEKDSQMNKSLGNICNSLDNSYVAKRARSSKKKISSQIQQEARRKIKQDEELAKMLKDKGLRNILSRLRENVQNSGTKPVQIIKSSKLISCGTGLKASGKREVVRDDQEAGSLRKRSSKVMINPVPVDIVRKSMVSNRSGVNSPSSPDSPQKRPQSILKTSNILGRSLSGISAIQFHD